MRPDTSPGLRTGLRTGIATVVRWLSAAVESRTLGKHRADFADHPKSNKARRSKERERKRRASDVTDSVKQLPHDNPAFISKLETRRHSATPELAKLREYTLTNHGRYDLAKLSTLYAAAGMLKYASSTLDQVYKDERKLRPTASQWIELMEAGRRGRDPVFAREMMETMRQREGRAPSKRMHQVLLNTYAESGMAEEALRVYEEMANQHGNTPDMSMVMAVLKACIRQRDLPESFIDHVVDVIQREHHPLPRRVMSMVLMAYAARDTNTVERCFDLATALEARGPLRARDLLALLRACREAGDIERGDIVLDMIDRYQSGQNNEYNDGSPQGVQRGAHGDVHGKEEGFDVSLATEVCRLHFVAGRVERAKETFEAVPFESRDLALYNVMVESLDDEDATWVFDEAWQRGLFGRRQRKLSSNGRIAHIDLHRLGLDMAERAIDRHLEELQGTDKLTDTEGSVRAVKVIVGKGKPANAKMRLCEHVRYLLYERGITYTEASPCVFTLST